MVTSTVSTAMRSKARRLPAEAQREFADAVAAFREAAELRPDWADPYLGLARTFIYGLEDVERGADALLRAERAGYTPGNREAAQLGDGYRTRADTLLRERARCHGPLAGTRLSDARRRVVPAGARTLRESDGLHRRAAQHRAVAALADDRGATAGGAAAARPPSFEAESKPWR